MTVWKSAPNLNRIDIKPMQIETWLSPTAVGPHEHTRARVAVVIDVLRATTVVTTAIAAGARSVTTCLDIQHARTLKHAWHGDTPPLLCGERECRPIEGFDFGNSPSEYSPAVVAGRDLVMTTTNGTRAIDAAADCDIMLLACFANLTAVAEAIIAEVSAPSSAVLDASEFASSEPTRTSGLVRIVCAGTNGAVTSEDALLAGALIAVCHRKLSDTARFYDGPIDLVNDSGSIALAAWQHCVSHDKVVDSASLSERFAMTGGGKNLVAAGYANDLVDCASIDVFDQVPLRDRLQPPRFIGR